MISRLLQIKDSVVQVADGMSWDYLLSSEWHKLSALRDLLIPFAEHTQLLHSDTQSLSFVVPAILDLQGHLSEFPHAQGSSFKDLASLAIKIKANMDKRFSCFLDHTDSKFSHLAAAACFLDPTVAPEALLENDDEQIEALLRRSEDYLAQLVPPVVREEEAEDEELAEGEESKEEQPHNKRPRFRFLSKPSRPSKSTISKPRVKEEIKKFKEQLSQPTNQETALEFWAAQGDYVYPSLKPIALDLLAMPASQAFAERVFSITGDLSRGRRNRARVILERSAFLKLNRVEDRIHHAGMDGLLRNCATGCRVDEAFTMDDLVDSISADTSGLRCGHVQLRIVFITPCFGIGSLQVALQPAVDIRSHTCAHVTS
ncbi:hypothetical protein DPX16_23449 [Anabarilius grahami]|uniref:HAT C-terminal dimerisation domain-containing protein n=1 Tax=Anabarilius grahami TaxID=495550 RepID=A0A3N0YRF7_ANAGA|nr:hypothetical protein DPX16_23449 [Anabarilius grahami]